MSSSSYPINTPLKRKDRPHPLDIPNNDPDVVSHPDGLHEPPDDIITHWTDSQPAVDICVTDDDSPPQYDPSSISRSASSTSSLDPYYFGIRSPSHSPAPPLPIYLSTTPDHQSIDDPLTPARNPAAIDRRGLVGVGELATPRWARSEYVAHDTFDDPDTASRHENRVHNEGDTNDGEYDAPDSPWTIEAVDGESSERDEPMDLKPPPRPLRTRPSIADESGGEEILYPRKPNGTTLLSLPKPPPIDTAPAKPQPSNGAEDTNLSSPTAPVPPSSFTPARRAKKRTSDEFEIDHSGTPLSKRAGTTQVSKEKHKDEKPSSRKHKSLNVNTTLTGSSRDFRGKVRRESTGLALTTSATKSPETHMRRTSTSSPSSNQSDGHYSRRVHADYSHLPPSPSSTSIHQFMRPPVTGSKDAIHSSPNVAHSLLRGTQEGWSGLDDEATAEALRKLDGLTGKTTRARASVSSFGRLSSSSRPGTPAGKTGTQWEGVTSSSDSGKSKRGSANEPAMKDGEPGHSDRETTGMTTDSHEFSDPPPAGVSGEEQALSSPAVEKTPKKNSTGARLSFTPKRGSVSSTNYASTPTTSSRESASMSASTSITSVSVGSGRHSNTKLRRNSASSDISSIHSNDATALKDRVASLAANGDGVEDTNVPPVPPLPKDLSSYRSPPTTSAGLAFSPLPNADKEKIVDSDTDHPVSSLEVPFVHGGFPVAPSSSPGHRQKSHHSSTSTVATILPEQAPTVLKTPSKKWSFSSALNLKLSSSPSSSSHKSSGFPLSPRAVTFTQQIRKSTSKDYSTSAASSKGPWSPNQPEAMASAGSLASLSSVGSIQSPALVTTQSRTPDRVAVPSRPGTASSASTSHLSSAVPPAQPGPLSPATRAQSKRLTPSSIPFFRRSSSQSMQMPTSMEPPMPSSPTHSTGNMSAVFPNSRNAASPTHDYVSLTTSAVPSSAHKKSSVLSLGLPSLLKSSSRRSLHTDSKDAAKEAQRLKAAAKDSEREKNKAEKKKDDKDRSESRISVLMNRKRGKTLSSTDNPRKPKSPVNLPPMQISALEPATAQRVARLRSSLTPTVAAPGTSRTSSSSSSRLTSQTVSSMQKQSDTSLRSRNQLPTIAGSPSVGINGSANTLTSRDGKDSSLSNSLPKETPTKIPRISSRTSGTSPSLKYASTTVSRRASVNVSAPPASSTDVSPTSLAPTEFGVIEGDDGTPKTAPVRQGSMRVSPSYSTSRVPRQASTVNSAAGSILNRKSNRDSISFIGLRKASTSSVASISTPASTTEKSQHRFSALSPSNLLGPKSSLPSSRSSAANQNIHQAMGSPSSSRQSLSTPSPAPSVVDEEELMGDEEMMHYIRRQHAKKLAAGATQEELDEMLKFPEPIPPELPTTPAAILKSSQAQYLSEYERKEILDYPNVYCFGAKSKKKPAVLDNTTNNHGYDDERGDYLVVNHDHLAYRYEVIDTLGKGSFGQVLNCRDHSTGESVAIKIIRNKKRFHHQALVEIKILDNLRKWDAEEKHHVIKMTEHFYFRNHLCIAMELLSINLYELIKANGFVGFTTALIRRFTSQMLLSLSLMRHHRIVHCDLKPENVLLRHPAKSGIKVIDFGSSCFEHEKIYTYIQSRFYRSPEVILGMNYHMAIDMWSLGCILAELFTGFPIFPGENEQEQLSCIMEVLGVPDKEFVNRSSRKKLFFDTNGAPRAVVNSKGRRRRPGTKTLAQVLRCNDEEFVDFISKCLVWDPERRIKPQAAMRHPFVTANRRPKPPSSSTKLTPGLAGTRSKHLNETPKKSLISAPTPLAARASRTTVNGGPTTPNSSYVTNAGSSSRSFRASQSQGLSSFSSSRTLSSFTSSTNK